MSTDTHLFDIKRINNHLRLVLKSTDFSGIVKALRQHFSDAGDFFHGESIIIDAYGIVQPLPWKKLATVLEENKLSVLGIYTNARLLPTVLDEGFEHIDLSKKTTSTTEEVSSQPPKTMQDKSSTAPVAPKREVPATSATNKDNANASPAASGAATLLVDRQLRSGERVYAAGGDLIIVGNVGHGAEVIADGNIHVYGHLLGRAIAGAKGNGDARIFTTYLDPQLVAIAGIYRLFDGDGAPDTLKKPTMVSLKNETLSFDLIKS